MGKLKKLNSCIYFVSDGEYIKIGITDNIFKRLSSLQNGNPRNLELLGIYSGGIKTEKAVHKKFKSLSCRGEWFKYHADIINHINTLKDGELLKKHKEAHTVWYGQQYKKQLEQKTKPQHNVDQNLVKEEIYNLFPCSPAGLYYHLKTNDDEESLFNDIDILEKIKKDNNVVGPGRRY